MPWTIPNVLLHDKPARLGNMRSHGRSRMFVVCGNPFCHHNAEIDASDFPDDVTFGDLQPRMLCTVCDHRGADVSPSWLHADWSRPFDDPITLSAGDKLVTLLDAGNYITSLLKAEQDLEERHTAIQALIMAAENRGPLTHARIGMLRALNRNVERAVNPDRKDTQWGKRKLKREL